MQDLLQVRNLYAGYNGIDVVRNINFCLKEKEILGIVGESGCGKTTLLKAISKLEGLATDVHSGEILFYGKDMGSLSKEEIRKSRGREFAYVFQNPESSLNPSRKIRLQFYEAISAHKKMTKKEMDKEILDLFVKLGLKDGERVLRSYPFELSGGMAQRVAIAMAVILRPKLLLADEPTSALDATVQKQVLEELLRLRDTMHTAIVMITHNIGVVSKMADKIGVMYGGRLVEYGSKEEVLHFPSHPYTRALLEAVPKIGGDLPKGLDGRPPRFEDLEEGCAFSSRCPHHHSECDCFHNEVVHLGHDHQVMCEREKS